MIKSDYGLSRNIVICKFYVPFSMVDLPQKQRRMGSRLCSLLCAICSGIIKSRRQPQNRICLKSDKALINAMQTHFSANAGIFPGSRPGFFSFRKARQEMRKGSEKINPMADQKDWGILSPEYQWKLIRLAQ